VDETLPAPKRPPALDDPSRDWAKQFLELQKGHDVRTMALLQLEDREALCSAAADLGRRYDYLADWSRTVEGRLTWLVEDPPCVAWIERMESRDRYDIDNFVANQLSRLLVHRRFGRLPHWMRMGLAWHFELELMGNLYTFPYSIDRIAEVPTGGWGTELRLAFKKRERLLSLEEVAGWRYGTFDEDAAARAWGLTRFLVERHSAALPRALDLLAALCFEKGRRDLPGGGWIWVLDFEPAAAEQLEILERELGEGLLMAATESFRRK